MPGAAPTAGQHREPPDPRPPGHGRDPQQADVFAAFLGDGIFGRVEHGPAHYLGRHVRPVDLVPDRTVERPQPPLVRPAEPGHGHPGRRRPVEAGRRGVLPLPPPDGEPGAQPLTGQPDVSLVDHRVQRPRQNRQHRLGQPVEILLVPGVDADEHPPVRPPRRGTPSDDEVILQPMPLPVSDFRDLHVATFRSWRVQSGNHG
jgi:hypothetical protein